MLGFGFTVFSQNCSQHPSEPSAVTATDYFMKKIPCFNKQTNIWNPYPEIFIYPRHPYKAPLKTETYLNNDAETYVSDELLSIS